MSRNGIKIIILPHWKIACYQLVFISIQLKRNMQQLDLPFVPLQDTICLIFCNFILHIIVRMQLF